MTHQDYRNRLPAPMIDVFDRFAALPPAERCKRLSEFQNAIEAVRPATLHDADTYQLEQDLIALTK